MAGPLLKRPRTVAWLPPRTAGAAAGASTVLGDDAPLRLWREGAAAPEAVVLGAIGPLHELAVVYDARDVLLLPALVPPLSGARLQQALPNLIEDELLQDPASCRIAVGPALDDGRRVLGVVDRAWHDAVVAGFERHGARVVAAWPAPLSLPWRIDAWSLAAVGDGLVLRHGAANGFGWAVPPGELQAAAEAALALADSIAQADGQDRPTAIDLYATEADALPPLEAAAITAGLVPVSHPLPAPGGAALDLMTATSGRAAAGRLAARLRIAQWRWPLRLAAACALAWIAGLNLQWGRLEAEHDAIAAAIEQRARAVLPAGVPVVDPVVQMRRRIDQQRARAGETAPDDFAVLLAQLADALGPRAPDALASADYRDGRLRVRFQPGWADAAAARDALREAAAGRRLRLQFDEREPVATVSLAS